jgi:hypothetical protein
MHPLAAERRWFIASRGGVLENDRDVHDRDGDE